MKVKRIDVGDFIYCRSPYHRDQLSIPEAAGLVLEIKRNNYRLLYGSEQFCWLPGETIVRVDGEINAKTLAGRLHYLIKALNPLDCELISLPNLYKATLRIDHIDDNLVDKIRELLGSDFLSLSVVPEGMAFMLAEVNFKK